MSRLEFSLQFKQQLLKNNQSIDEKNLIYHFLSKSFYISKDIMIICPKLRKNKNNFKN